MKRSKYGMAMALLALTSASLGQASQAQTGDKPPRWSAGLQLRNVNWSYPDLAGGNNDHNSVGLSLIVGRDFGRHFGIEFGYEDLGKVEQRDATQSGSAALRGLFVRGIGRVPLTDELSLVGRVGWLFGWMKTEGTMARIQPGYCCGAEINLGVPHLGLGLRWDAGRDWQFGIDAIRYAKYESTVVGEQTSIGLGVSRRF